jgi:ABC-type phosphate/phosphonate transport system substrate-binding protein
MAPAAPAHELVANARMYSTGHAAAAAWRELLAWVLARAGERWTVLDYPSPLPLPEFWERRDLGCALMCGLPFGLRAERPTAIAAPVVRGARYKDQPIYYTDLIVRTDSPFGSLEDTFGHRAGFTIRDSQSGYVGFRNHLMPFRVASGQPLFREVAGPLGGARQIVDALIEDRIDVGPIDSYFLDLIRHLEPDVGARVRVVASTRSAPVPLFMATAPLQSDTVRRLRDAFWAVADAPDLAHLRDRLLLRRFAPPRETDYDGFAARSLLSDRYPDRW